MFVQILFTSKRIIPALNSYIHSSLYTNYPTYRLHSDSPILLVQQISPAVSQNTYFGDYFSYDLSYSIAISFNWDMPFNFFANYLKKS